MKAPNPVLEWKQTRTGLLVTGIVEAILFYVFGSLAIDSGSYWHYLLALVFFVGTAHSLFKAIRNHVQR